MSCPSYAESVLTDNQDDWYVGYTFLLGIQLSANNANLTIKIPRLLMERLASIRHHQLDAKEQLNYAHQRLFKAVRMEEQRISILHQRRDEQALQRIDTSDIEKEISLLSARRQELSNINPSELEVTSPKLVSVVPRPNDMLLPVSRLVPLTTVKEADIDLLITGKIREIDGMLLLEFYALDKFHATPIFTFQRTLTRELVMETIDELASELADVLLGEQWGLLTVIPTPEQGAVYINDEFVGIGKTTVPYLKMGPHIVRATASGYEPLEHSVFVSRKEHKIDMTLVPFRAKMVKIITDPPGASVYLKARYIGITPLQLQQGEISRRILVRMEGYHDKAVILDEDSTNKINVSLVRKTLDLVGQQQLSRHYFYDQLGLALISIAGPLILFTAANEPAGNNREVLLGGGVISIALSGALMARAGVALGDYLKTADRRVP